MQRIIEYDVALMQRDMASRGWQPVDLAARAAVSKSTVSRFFDGSFQTPRTAAKLAKALGYSVRRYVVALQASA
jgi:plasmid maintenance system antidote protein VapI